MLLFGIFIRLELHFHKIIPAQDFFTTSPCRDQNVLIGNFQRISP